MPRSVRWLFIIAVLLGCTVATSAPPLTDLQVAAELDAYATLLRGAGETGRAGEVAAQADRLRLSWRKYQEAYQAYQQGRPYDTSFYLGFVPSAVLREYAAALRAGGRAVEADRIDAMANAWQAEQLAKAEALAAR